MAYRLRPMALAAAVAATLLAPSQAPAQGIAAPAPATKLLTFDGSVNGGYDGDDTSGTIPDSAGLNPLFFQSTSHFGGNVQLRYTVPGRRMGWGVGIGSAFQRYQTADTVLVNHNAAAGVSLGLTRHLRVTESIIGGYSPPYQANLFPSIAQSPIGPQVLTSIDGSLTTRHLISYGANTGLQYSPTNQSSIRLDHGYRRVRTLDGSFAGSVQEAYAVYRRGLTKSAGVQLGYRGQQYDFPNPVTDSRARLRAHNLDIGLDYGGGRGLTLSRRTTVAFAFGLATFADRHLDRLQVRAVGHAAVNQQLVRSWSLTGGYNRGLTFVNGFGVPIFSDTFNAGVGGQLTRRISAFASAFYSIDRYDVMSESAAFSSRYQSYRTIVGIRGRLAKQLNAFAQYVNYHHAYPEDALLLQGGLPTLNRQGVTGGLSFAIPLIGGRGQGSGVQP